VGSRRSITRYQPRRLGVDGGADLDGVAIAGDTPGRVGDVSCTGHLHRGVYLRGPEHCSSISSICMFSLVVALQANSHHRNPVPHREQFVVDRDLATATTEIDGHWCTDERGQRAEGSSQANQPVRTRPDEKVTLMLRETNGKNIPELHVVTVMASCSSGIAAWLRPRGTLCQSPAPDGGTSWHRNGRTRGLANMARSILRRP
jgi:hypothetical protein